MLYKKIIRGDPLSKDQEHTEGKEQNPGGSIQMPKKTRKILQPGCIRVATAPQRSKCNGYKPPVSYMGKGNSYKHE